MGERTRCAAVVYRRDTYRRTGRGSTGFELHYTRRQCSRYATVGDLCKQHSRWPNISRYENAPVPPRTT